MNWKMHLYILGHVLKIEALFMIPSGFISFFYKEYPTSIAFFGTVIFMLILGIALSYKQPENKVLFAKEGLRIAASSWVILSVFGAIPLFLSDIGVSFLDCLFEIVSGFTTTGSSILKDVEILPRGILFWRSFSHWIGGMGVLVFLLSITSFSNGSLLHIMQAESPGPSTTKLVPRVKQTAKILYSMYIFLTLIEIVLLVVGGMPLFDSLLNTFGTAGTGGFAIKNLSIGYYNSPYFEYVIGIFMILFGINFNAYFFILTKRFKELLNCEELKVYLGIIAASVILITLNIFKSVYPTILESFRYAFFQVSSIITTTGYATANYDIWPQFSRMILLFLMFSGACAGSTAGGMKVSRLIISYKQAKRKIKRLSHPKSVDLVRQDGKIVDEETVSMVNAFLILYFAIFVLSVLIVSLDSFDFDTTFSSVASCLNNIGPGLGMVGPSGNFSEFSPLSKFVLIIDMLMGRLEIFPIIAFFHLETSQVKHY